MGCDRPVSSGGHFGANGGLGAMATGAIASGGHFQQLALRQLVVVTVGAMGGGAILSATGALALSRSLKDHDPIAHHGTAGQQLPLSIL